MKSFFVFFLSVYFVANHLYAQQPVVRDSIVKDSVAPRRFPYKALIIPSVLIGYGLVGMESGQLKSFNNQIRSEVTEDIDRKLTVDDFMQYTPTASVFALDALGVPAKHSLRDRTVIMATSYLLLSGTVFGLKSITKIERPDGSSRNSFPSGHTANAFAGAEFLRQEYGDQSVWYGVAGYAVATGTGLFRMYNNRHWLTDVAAGAGIGILSTKIAYWVQPYLTQKLFKDKKGKTMTAVAPSYDGQHFGLGLVRTF